MSKFKIWFISLFRGPRPWGRPHYDGEWCECPAKWFHGGQKHPKRRPSTAKIIKIN